MPDDASPTEDFFVGYLPIGGADRRAMRLVSVAIGLLAIGAGALIAMAQRDPGPARWGSEVQTLEGMLAIDPYPALRLPRADGSIERVLIVELGKVGASRRLGAHGGASLRLRGTIIEREGRRVLELLSGDDAISLIGAPLAIRDVESESTGVVTLAGVVVDPKCFLGAMKPGVGKAHRACASLCILGGIPPVLFEESGEFTLVADADGNAIDPGLVVPFVDELIEMTGSLHVHDEMRILRVDPGAIRRR